MNLTAKLPTSSLMPHYYHCLDLIGFLKFQLLQSVIKKKLLGEKRQPTVGILIVFYENIRFKKISHTKK